MNTFPGNQRAPQAQPGAAEAATLGNNTKSSSPPSVRSERYRLQAIARDLFITQGCRENMDNPMDYHRTAKCLYTRIDPSVGVHLNGEHKRAFYSGLMLCGSVWSCPLCAAKVQARRREEIQEAFRWVYEDRKDLKAVMVTLTFPHKAWNNLGQLLEQQADALTRLRRGKVWQRVKGRMGFVGLIRGLELTHGKNGWHPHTHEIWIVDKNCDAAELLDQIVTRWTNCCERAGLLSEGDRAAFLEHSVDLHDEAHAGDYLVKQDDAGNLVWGADSELANSALKGSGKGRHPFQLLASAAEKNDQGKRDDQAKRDAWLFLEFTRAMKGKRQLFWSRGLKALVGIEDKPDEELAEEQREEADALGELSPAHWNFVIRNRLRSEVLEVAEKGGRQALLTWFREKGQPLFNPGPMPVSGDPSGSCSGETSAASGPSPAGQMSDAEISWRLRALRAGDRGPHLLDQGQSPVLPGAG